MIRNRKVGWTTLYIHGRSGAEAEILHSLEHSGLNFMPGYANEDGLLLFWIDETEPLRSFKKAIGGKTIFKYRLRFYSTVEAFVESKSKQEGNSDLHSGDNDDAINGWPTSLDKDERERLSA
jgi:hypothetical protein